MNSKIVKSTILYQLMKEHPQLIVCNPPKRKEGKEKFFNSMVLISNKTS